MDLNPSYKERTMQEVIWKCDCGCGVKAVGDYEQKGWFILNQKETDTRVATISHTLHFVNLSHLAKWAEEALLVGKSLEKSYLDGPRHCGTLGCKDFPTIQV